MDWQGGLKFSGKSLFGHTLTTDGSKKAGGNEEGYQPLELLMFGLAGCTGIDVILIAEKMKVKINDLKINISADQREEHPRAFTRAHIEYVVTGENVDPKKLERIIDLSEQKYCSASATLSGVTKITHSYKILEG
jgi:putative redox protein